MSAAAAFGKSLNAITPGNTKKSGVTIRSSRPQLRPSGHATRPLAPSTALHHVLARATVPNADVRKAGETP